MKKIFCIAVSLMFFCLLLYVVCPVSALDPWYSDSWLNRKSMTISNNRLGSQMKVVIGNSSGGDVSCGGKVKSDFSDLLFTDSFMNVLSYWIENYTINVQATVWINNSLNVSKMYMYYANPSASFVSNGNTTFYFFDGFYGSSLNVSKWSKTGTITANVSNGECVFHQNAVIGYYESVSFGKNYAIRYRYKNYVGHRVENVGFGLKPVSPYTTPEHFCYSDGGSNLAYFMWTDTIVLKSQLVGYNIDRYALYDVIRTSSNVIGCLNGSQVMSSTSNIPVGSLKVSVGQKSQNVNCGGTFDWIFVRRYFDVQSTFTGFGSQETNFVVPACPVYFEVLSYNSSCIKLNWSKGLYADSTVVYAKRGSYPVKGVDVVVYNGSGLFYNHTSLLGSSQWFYRCYSWNDSGIGAFSSTYLRGHDTTRGNATFVYSVNLSFVGVYGFVSWNGTVDSNLSSIEFNVTGDSNIVLNADVNTSGDVLYIAGFELNSLTFELLLLLGLFYVAYKISHRYFYVHFFLLACGIIIVLVDFADLQNMFFSLESFGIFALCYITAFIVLFLVKLKKGYDDFEGKRKKKRK